MVTGGVDRDSVVLKDSWILDMSTWSWKEVIGRCVALVWDKRPMVHHVVF